MNNLKFIVLIILISIVNNIYAQRIDKVFEEYNKKNYKKAITDFKALISKKKNIIEAKYGLGLIYSNNKYKKFRYDRAYRFILYAQKKYLKLENKEKQNLLKFNISKNSIQNLISTIIDSAFKEAIKTNTIEVYNEFINDYKDTIYSKKVKDLRNSLAFKIHTKQKSRIALLDFINFFPNAKEVDSARALIKIYDEKAFKEYTYEGELDLIERFEKLYPNYKNKAKLNKEKQLAAKIFRLDINRPYNKLLHSFYVDYITEAAPRELAFVTLQRIITPSLQNKNWQAAIDTLKKYQKHFNNDNKINKMIEILSAPVSNLKLESISNIINTKGHEYAPVVTVDNKTMYFCGRNRKGNIGLEDIFVSKQKNNTWTEPKLINGVNTPMAHEAPLAISADGNTLIIYFNRNIYYSKKQYDRWLMPRKFPSVNIDYSWEADAMLSSDGNAILFISDRKSNIGKHNEFGKLYHGAVNGNLNIYVCTKTENGWSKPINLGKTINTPYAERSPFLHADMKTLYFSSDGHGGLGNLDVYKSTRLNDSSWTEWSEPVNLGKAINTYGDEYDYKISTNGKYAFLSSYKDNFDINKIQIPINMRPGYVAIISGTIKNSKKQNIKAKIKWEDLKTGKIMGLSENNIVDGNYTITLPLGKNYGYFIEHKDYYPLSGNIDLKKQKKQIEITKNFTLRSYVEIINNKVSIPLANVFFEHNKATLKTESYNELNRLIKFINKNKNLKIEISGHTDNTGTTAYNKKLSQKRAEAVKHYLVSRGCRSANLIAIGYGEAKPVADNNTDKGKAKNRRVEFKVK